ncbi:MAG: hypothetical protein ACR5LA_09135 [Wolbachia sp.]
MTAVPRDVIPVSSTDRLFLRLSYLSILFRHSAKRIQLQSSKKSNYMAGNANS